jgi:streptogramin lyase
VTTLRRPARVLLLALALGLVAASCAKREPGPKPGPKLGSAAATRATSRGHTPGHELIHLFPFALGSQPHGIVLGPDGNIWFTLWNRGEVAAIVPEEPFTVTEVPLPRPCGQTDAIAPGPDGAVWCVAANGYRIVRVTAAEPHDFQVFERMGNFRELWGIAPAPGGMLWMAGARRLVRMTATVPPEYEEYPFAYSRAAALDLAVDSGGAVWFTRVDGAIGRANAGSPLTPEIFALPDPKCSPQGIAVGPDETIWFTESAGNAIGRFDPFRNEVQEFSLPTPDAKPRSITSGPDGALWFTEHGAGKVGRIAAREPFAVTEFAVPSTVSRPWGIAPGPDGNVWFTDAGADAVGRIDLAVARDRIQASEESARAAGVHAKTTVLQATGTAGRTDGQLVVGCDADCTVSLDGTELFRSVKGQSRTVAVAPGWHVISAVGAADGRRLTKPFEAFAGRTAFVPFAGLAPPEPTRTPPWRRP